MPEVSGNGKGGMRWVAGQFDFRSIEKTRAAAHATTSQKMKRLKSGRRLSGNASSLGRGNLIAAAPPPRYFVTRSSSGEANSHNKLTEDTQEPHDDQNYEENTKHNWQACSPAARRTSPLVLKKQNPGPERPGA
jgi:hypothetical protein